MTSWNRPGAICALAVALAPPALRAHAPNVGLTTRYLNFVAAPGGPNPPAQVVALSNTTHGRMPWSASVLVIGSGGNWLNVSPGSGTLPGQAEFERVNLTITATSAGLAAGVYSALITISAPGDSQSPPADNSPQIIEVALAVNTTGTSAPGIALAPSSLAFEGVTGTGRVFSRSVQISNTGAQTLNWTATAVPESGGRWLSVTPASGLNGGGVAVSAAVGNLASGAYQGRVTFAAPGAANSPRSLPVTFQVRNPLPPSLQLSASTLNFTGQPGAANAQPQSLIIANGGDGALAWRVSATTFNGGAWLSVTPGAGSAPGSVIVTAETGELPAGTYAGRVTITADGVANSPFQVAVAFTVRRPQPAFDLRSLVNAATFLAGPVAPGQLVSLFGQRLGPAQGVVFTLDHDRLPTTLGGTRITFDGVPAPLFYVSAGQVNLQLPYELARRTSTQMVVNVEGYDPASLVVPLTDAAPGVFTIDGSRAAALNQDFTLNGPENRAAPGSVVQLFFTGQGRLDIPVETGVLAPTSPPFPKPVEPVYVTIDGLQARVLFAGLAPGFVGLTQVNAEVPRDVFASSRVGVAVGVGFNVSPRLVTIAVSQ